MPNSTPRPDKPDSSANVTNVSSPRSSLVESLQLLSSRILPHDTKKTTCPPAPLISGDGPLIIVASLMRSGTHLLLDSLFNNFSSLRRSPLFLDFDAYQRQSLPPAPLNSITGVVIKTHFPETPLAEPYASALAALAPRALVLMPRRPTSEIRKSLAKWGVEVSAAEFDEIESRFLNFWTPFSPLTIEFSALLNPPKVQALLAEIAKRASPGLRQNSKLVMPSQSRFGVYVDKLLTRLSGKSAPRINTTIGYRLSSRQRA
jgi:hypothetical protein